MKGTLAASLRSRAGCARQVDRRARAQEKVAIARLVIRGRPPRDARKARDLLLHALRTWPGGITADFLLMPGGFVSEAWPSRWTSGWGWNSDANALAVLHGHVAACVSRVIDKDVLNVGRKRVKAIVFGIDVGPDESTGALAELAVVYDLERAEWTLTGKSFLRGDQRRVVRIAQLASHFVAVADQRVLVLGCHDLNIFSPRGRSLQRACGRLAVLRREMDLELERFAPTVALQLPHGTDTPRTWSAAWNALTSVARLRAWASGISYFHPEGGNERSTFEEVCDKTFGGATCLDVIA